MDELRLAEIIYPPEDEGKIIVVLQKVNTKGNRYQSWTDYEVHLLGDGQVFQKEADCIRMLNINYTRMFELLYG